MKTTTKLLTVLMVLLLFSSCLKEDHTIRMKNNFPVQINNVMIGKADIGTVNSGGTSSYKSINTGNFTISGVATTGQSLSGSGTISGKGQHKWTVTVSSAGSVSIAEDK